jgi:cytochrome P450
MRTETAHALAPRILRRWQAEIKGLAEETLDKLGTGQPVDLVHDYAVPVCLRVTTLVTGISSGEAVNLLGLAAEISAAAAEPFDENLAARAKTAEAQLRPHFRAGPLPLRESGFVALSQTLPRMLANLWLGFIERPSAWRHLHLKPALMPRAIEELLRSAGLTRILFRMASQPTDLNGIHIQEGDRLILRLDLANQDSEHFPCPNHLILDRRPVDHFSLGNGRHSCVGAPLIRMVLVTLTRLLVERFGEAAACHEIRWQGGSGFRFPDALYVSMNS